MTSVGHEARGDDERRKRKAKAKDSELTATLNACNEIGQRHDEGTGASIYHTREEGMKIQLKVRIGGAAGLLQGRARDGRSQVRKEASEGLHKDTRMYLEELAHLMRGRETSPLAFGNCMDIVLFVLRSWSMASSRKAGCLAPTRMVGTEPQAARFPATAPTRRLSCCDAHRVHQVLAGRQHRSSPKAPWRLRRLYSPSSTPIIPRGRHAKDDLGKEVQHPWGTSRGRLALMSSHRFTAWRADLSSPMWLMWYALYGIRVLNHSKTRPYILSDHLRETSGRTPRTGNSVDRGARGRLGVFPTFSLRGR
ncbi:uncharacterized protein SCHCODRAFT_02359212 [Schizophyllum commune H4-8]|uniref:uncharacterized protein n=1 Tax=Schizophyllum commune (strain H4-8 / FGSC 9210) TaxID=578458 RepID=UPI00215E24AC|nr:uncharacterized protein SCHCODRAFT_02359212 [Schizophyllum commune H4-8]KAI5889097.1 hypothetical protein SCHCODRAFT_02359212 [Schizophyllum commune H4-8]